jgi:hypothetical protein
VSDAHDHLDVVNHWLAQTAHGLSSHQLLHLFDQAMAALCQRAYLTLGEVTLTAIVDRVLYNAAEKFALFESLEPAARGVNCQGLLERLNAGNEGDLPEGIRFVLVEFLTVIGNLTAEILTPALHSALSKVVFKDTESGGNEAREGN